METREKQAYLHMKHINVMRCFWTLLADAGCTVE